MSDTSCSSSTSKSPFPIRIGDLGILAFHGFRSGEASRIHVECQQESLSTSLSSWCVSALQSAVVLDHLYIFSLSQLRAAIHRLHRNALDGEHAKLQWSDISRALALSNNLQWLSERLPAGPETKCVVIFWKSNKSFDNENRMFNHLTEEAQAICAAVQRVSSSAESHSLVESSTTSRAALSVSQSCCYSRYADFHKIEEFYNFSTKNKHNRSLKTPVSVEYPVDENQWATLEKKVVGKLALCGI